MMPKEDAIRLVAVVSEALPSATFRCKLKDNGHEVLAHLSGNMRQNLIKVIPGDIVTLELSPYDLTKGRIIYRGATD